MIAAGRTGSLTVSIPLGTALVTGGTRGLGRAIAEMLVRAGLFVRITGRDPQRLHTAVEELSQLGDAKGHVLSLEDRGAIDALVAEISSEQAALGILVNNAGRVWRAPLEVYPLDQFDRVLQVNLVAPFALVSALLPLLKMAATHDTPARVINIGSSDGIGVPGAETYAYGASKAGLHHLTRHLASQLAPHHITVNTIAPGTFATDLTGHFTADPVARQAACAQIPLGRLGDPQEVAGAVVYLASELGSYVTGATLVIDGGACTAKPWFDPPRTTTRV